MKKIFISLFLFSLCQLCFAQKAPLPGPELIVREMLDLIPKPVLEQPVLFIENIVNGQYQTTEENRLMMSAEEYMEFYAKKPLVPAPETKTTNKYTEAIINIPAAYLVYNVNIANDKQTNKPHLFLTNDLISIQTQKGDVSFKLDYRIYPSIKANQHELNKYGYEYNLNNKPLTVVVKYDPKYFTLKKVNNYEPNKDVTVSYKGKTITLNTVTKSFLYIEDKDGNVTEFVLEPNFQNLYKDFKFVREGHKEVKFIDL